MIIVNNQHEATVTQTVLRLVACEECDAEYIYSLTREGSGYGNSVYFLDEEGAKERASRRAEENLENQMRSACNAVPCPKCGHYQDHMLPRARAQRAGIYKVGAGLALILMIVFLVLALKSNPIRVGLPIAGVCFLAMLALGMVALIIHVSYNPNKKSEEERLEIAAKDASLRNDFERAQAVMAVEDFEQFCKKIAKKKKRRFEFSIWVDRGQIKHADEIDILLPSNEASTIQLRSKMRDGDQFTFSHEVDEYTVQMVGVLNVYTKRRA
jgi:acyl-CoA synthetase (AMP-forming)/AMP-acid ligase II